MPMRACLLVCCVVCSLAGIVALPMLSPAGAQETNRYTIERTDEGYVRLDTQTGEMSLCREQGRQLVCQMAAEERRAFESKLDALSNRLAIVERRLDEEAGSDMPSDAEIDRTMGIMEQFMRRFFGLIDEFQRDFGGSEEPEETYPDRT